MEFTLATTKISATITRLHTRAKYDREQSRIGECCFGHVPPLRPTGATAQPSFTDVPIAA